MDLRDPITSQYFNQEIDFDQVGAIFGGITFTLDLVARLTGALDDSIVVLELGEFATFTMMHPMQEHPAQRIVAKNRLGELFIINSNLRLVRTGTGLGTRMLAHQAYAARTLGFERISLCAGQDHGRPRNGNYTWARCGFDADLPYTYAAAQENIRKWSSDTLRCNTTPINKARIDWLLAWPPALHGALRVQDLMSTEEGIAWWKACPIGRDMEFDLGAGSQSWRILEAYLSDAGIFLGSNGQFGTNNGVMLQ